MRPNRSNTWLSTLWKILYLLRFDFAAVSATRQGKEPEVPAKTS